MEKFRLPNGYEPKLSLLETERAIECVRHKFQAALGEALNLTRVSAPMFVLQKTGLNDNLNGTEHPVSFYSEEVGDDIIEVVHSLAKWKRDALKRYGFETKTGLYTDMNAIRKDEFLDNTHSLYVDQWDWELLIEKEDRNLDFLKSMVTKIYEVVRNLQEEIFELYPALAQTPLPREIYFITSQALEDLYPTYSPEERETLLAKEKGAVCVTGIGHPLKSGQVHGHRSPDYDDWRLNADIILYHPILDEALELSSLGIRVDAETLRDQLQAANATSRSTLPYHLNILEGRLPLTIGGGIGQSRLCMFMLQKAHIGEVQASVWDEATEKACQAHGIELL